MQTGYIEARKKQELLDLGLELQRLRQAVRIPGVAGLRFILSPGSLVRARPEIA